ncbi:hypothetical protein TIFTF001_020004 [Ficus carica]|uniref:Secreted protein n=1 Tax=Ficus carica TaxID=3494 RepID=A0AA88AR59_FICCA|nr:hypothetical protein TIFTF001_020004 [Ficus carica]
MASTLVVAVVFVIDLIAFALAVVAEQRRTTELEVRWHRLTPFIRRTIVDSKLRSRRNRTFDRPALFYAPLYPERKRSFAPLGARRSRGSRERKRTHPLLHLARDYKERASSINEQWIEGALGIALFFSPFLSASSDLFV